MPAEPLAPPEALSARPGYPWRRFGRDFGYVTIFNVVCALAITFVLGANHFFPNLVASLCIGTLAFVFIDGSRLWLWGEQSKPNWLVFCGVVVVAVPLAQVIGIAIAGALLGMNFRPLGSFGSLLAPQAVGMLMFTLLATLIAIVLFAGRDKMLRAEALAASERARAEAVERRALQAQLQALQAQVEPHMLFNTLANLQGLIGLDPARAQHMLDQLIQYLRATLQSSRAESTTLAQEFALIESYLGLMSVRMGARLRYTLELPDRLGAFELPLMLLQPLVENAITHGLEPKIEGGHITISARADGGVLRLTVSDDGLGLDAPSAKAGTRLGLSNTRARLHALYGEQASLTLEPGSDGGACATLALPLPLSLMLPLPLPRTYSVAP